MKSELCKNCGIQEICHEPQKWFAKACQHFIGELPEGFYMTEAGACKFIETHWRGHEGYFLRPYGKQWVERHEFNWILKRGQDRLEPIKKHSKRSVEVG